MYKDASLLNVNKGDYIMKKALIGTLEKYLNLEEFYKDFIIKLETIILNNKDTIKQLLNKTVETYKPIKFEEEKQIDEEKRYVYKLTRGEAAYDTIYVLVNGESERFDLVTGIKTASL